MPRKCESKKKNGERCGADVQIGRSLCVFHDPARATDGQRARRADGVSRSQRAVVLPEDTPDHPLSSPKDVADLLAHSINQLRRGQIDVRIANGIGYLAGVLLRALEQGPVEERLTQLEAIVAKSGVEAEMFSFRIDSRHGPLTGMKLSKKQYPSTLPYVEPSDSIRQHFCDRIVPVRPRGVQS